MDNAPCATANGEDCCGDLLCVAGQCLAAGAYPNFQAPFPCDESWTYSHHDMEVRRALDFVNDNGATDARPALAAAAGVATQHYEAGGAGNYIVVEHGGGWKTYYFHLQAFSVGDGTAVAQGQEVGLIGSTGASSGPHLHFEELLNGQGMDIVINGQALAPYPGSYFEQSIVSENGCPP
ncbi:MAG: M23 family metallopeptidase [Polyangiaceae bacterium]|nr:M23 family metallopeptidase [Polyangiaceae bacterium]